MTHTQSLILNVENSLNIIKNDLILLEELKQYEGDFWEANDRMIDNKIESLNFEVKRINLLLKDLVLSTF